MGTVKIVHNRLLGGWYVVRGPHHTPLSGAFSSRAAAVRWLQEQQERRDAPRTEREGSR